MAEREKPVTDWQLERLAQGELPEEAAREIERKLGPEATRERLAELAASSEQILARLPPDVIGPAIRRRLSARRPSRARWLMALVPVAAAVGLLTLQAPTRRGSPVVEGIDQDTRAKGTTRLLAYRASPDGGPLARLDEAARVRPHDVIQLAYTSAEPTYGVILSVDGRGVVTQHLPTEDGPRSPSLAAAGEVRLPRSYELDDAPGFERFFLVTGPRPFTPADVLAAARDLGRSPAEARRRPLALAPELRQQSLLLEKVKP